jgi:hypothetical protein
MGLFINFTRSFNMAMIWNKGTVSLFANTKGEVIVKPDPDGKFTAENVAELYETMLQVAKKNKLTPKVYKPEASGNTPLLFADRWGKPYIAILPASKAPSNVVVKKVMKLA